MQAKTTPNVKTPGKKNRKSIANSSPNKQNGAGNTPVSKKNTEGKPPLTPFVKASGGSPVAASPNKKKNVNTPKPVKTPKQKVENTPKTASPAKTPNTAGGKQKRKQSLAAAAETPAKQPKLAENGKQKGKQSPVANGDGAPSPKQKKLEKFHGTSKLKNFDDKAEKAQKKLERLQKRKNRRNAIGNAFKTLKEGGQLTPAFVNSVQSSLLKLEKIAATKKLSKSANRKLQTYRKLQKLIEASGGSKLTKQQKAPVAAPKQKQQAKKAQIKKENPAKKEKATAKVEEEDDDDEEEEDDSDIGISGEEDTEDESGDEEEEEEVIAKPVAPKQKQGKKAPAKKGNQWGKKKKQ